jgi:hypothetical protein
MSLPLQIKGRVQFTELGAVFPADLGAACSKCDAEGTGEFCGVCGGKVRPRAALSQGEWKGLWPQLRGVRASLNFILGDWINYGVRCWGEKYALALEATQLEYQTLRDVASVCRRVPLSLRNDKLDWSHHVVVAALPEGEQGRFLREAEEQGWTVAKLREARREAQGDLGTLPKMPRTFNLRAYRQEFLRWRQSQDFTGMPDTRKAALKGVLEQLRRDIELVMGEL